MKMERLIDAGDKLKYLVVAIVYYEFNLWLFWIYYEFSRRMFAILHEQYSFSTFNNEMRTDQIQSKGLLSRRHARRKQSLTTHRRRSFL